MNIFYLLIISTLKQIRNANLKPNKLLQPSFLCHYNSFSLVVFFWPNIFAPPILAPPLYYTIYKLKLFLNVEIVSSTQAHLGGLQPSRVIKYNVPPCTQRYIIRISYTLSLFSLSTAVYVNSKQRALAAQTERNCVSCHLCLKSTTIQLYFLPQSLLQSRAKRLELGVLFSSILEHL